MIEAGSDGLVVRAREAFESFRAGDRDAFDALVTLLTPLLWHTVRSQGVPAASAEDVLQGVWLSLLRSAQSVRDPATVVKWLLTTARREAWRVARSERKVERVDDAEEVLDRMPAAHAVEPEYSTVRSEDDVRLWRHIGALSARCQELLRVIAFADRPDYAAISAAMGIPVGSIGPTRGRCLARLRAALTADQGWTP